MRIAYISVDPGIPVFGTKGASVHIQEVVRELRRRGHEVTVYTTRRGFDVPADLADLEVIEVPVPAGDTAAREQAQATAAGEIARQVIATQPDIVYERYSLFSPALADITTVTSAVGILEVNAPLIEEQRTHRDLINEEVTWLTLRLQARAAAATICVSEPVAQWVRTHTPTSQTVHAVANGVNVERITPQPEADDVIVTFVGTLKPWHGVADLLQAAAHSQGGWRLRIIGDGPERAKLEAQAAEAGLQVDFRGAVSPADMPAQLAGSAIGVAPYPAPETDDGHYFSPLKVYEYLAAGLPVVATSIGQIPQVLADCGVVVPPSAPMALAAALDALAADPQQRAELGQAARAQAEERHSWTGVVSQILELAGVTDA
ncbi:glycosyltransferase family 4 protein [Buchananella hordeovulneris]|uniref:glycosyltransferase family 4 protein n=1 Tax=Buchananella hordeovulneris TaxID=52770 RepID=UPI0026DADBF4|nr:glycosyltransferase family 4 protein [Buchananella hordeovulneris]MDO5081165.1 glycosyltransferase family 4 protein [Buchananella hordeovulneris]